MPTTFISKATNFQIALEPEGRPILNEHGVMVARTEGLRVRFQQGTHVARDPREADLMRKAKNFNIEFWEVGNEPGAVKPSTEDMLERIADAIARRNLKRLRELKDLEAVGDGEQGGHRRTEVLAAIDRALAIFTDGKEGKLGPGRPHPVKPEEE